MATSIFFNGRVTSTPGAYSQTDASALNSVGLGASGIVAMLGTAQGGMPYTAYNTTADIPRFTTATQAVNTYKSGDLLEAANMIFAPSKDANIPGGAQQVLSMKVNPATQSSITLNNANGPALIITSQDWGAFTSQININIGEGTTQGRMVTIKYENVTESVDNLGAGNVANLTYIGGGYSNMTASTDASGNITATGTVQVPSPQGAALPQSGAGKVTAIAQSQGDYGIYINIWGVGPGNTFCSETIVTNQQPVPSVNTYTTVLGAALAPNSPAIQASSIALQVGGNTWTSLTNSRPSGGVFFFNVNNNYAVNKPITVTNNSSSAGTQVALQGTNAAGTSIGEILNVAGAGATVASVNSYATLTMFAIGSASYSGNLSLNIPVAASSGTTVQSQADYFNSLQFTYNVLGDGSTLVSTLDPITNANIDNVQLTLTSGSNDIINWINANSRLVTASAPTGSSGGPADTGGSVYLTGGSEGTPTFADYQACLNFLKTVRVNTIVCLSSDPALAAAVDAHCTFMCGIGRSERDGFVGIMNPTLDGTATKQQTLAQIQALNTRNLRCCPDYVTVYNTSGVLQEFPPHFAAVIGAGMQAGAPVGLPLTNKYANIVSFRNDKSWNPIDDSDDMINGGTLFLQQIDGKGCRWVRNVTAYLADNNIAYVEGSVNQAVNYAAYNFRSAMELRWGKKVLPEQLLRLGL